VSLIAFDTPETRHQKQQPTPTFYYYILFRFYKKYFLLHHSPIDIIFIITTIISAVQVYLDQVEQHRNRQRKYAVACAAIFAATAVAY
jgi:hypothetical protein